MVLCLFVSFETEIYGIIAVFAVLHSIAIGVFLIFQNRHQPKASRRLGFTQISGAMILVSSLITTTNLYSIIPRLIGIPYPFIFLTGFLPFCM